MNKKIFAFIGIYLCSLVLIGAHSVYAAPATPSATPTTAADVEKSLQDRIKKALQDNLGSAQQNIDAQSNTSQIRAFVGTIESVSAKAITIKTVNGVKQAEISDSTTLSNDGKANAKITDLPLGNSIIAIGRSTDNQTLSSIKIIVTAPPEIDERIVVVASVSAVDVKGKAITMSSDKFSGKAKLSTRLMLMFDSVLNKITLDNINDGDKVFTIVHQLETGPVLTRLVNLSSTAPTSTPAAKAVCGNKVCDSSETPETCQADCQQ